MSSSSSLAYSSSSKYFSSFSFLPPRFHLFRQSHSDLQNSEHPICDFAQKHAIVLHFESEKNMFLNYVFSKNVSVVNVKRLVMMIKIKIANGDKENKPLADFGLQLCFKV